MANIQLNSPAFVHPPAKAFFNSGALRSSSSRSGSFAIKCSNNGGSANAKRNNNNNNNVLNGWVSGWMVELSNQDGRKGFVKSLRKAAQGVVQPEAETKKMEEVIQQLMTRDAQRVLVHHETVIKKMKQDLNHYKTRSEKKLAQQETAIMEMKQELSHHKARAAEIEECQKGLSEALTLVAEAELSLQNIMQLLQSRSRDCSGSVYL